MFCLTLHNKDFADNNYLCSVLMTRLRPHNNLKVNISIYSQDDRSKGNVIGLGRIFLQKSIMANEEEQPKFDLVSIDI